MNLNTTISFALVVGKANKHAWSDNILSQVGYSFFRQSAQILEKKMEIFLSHLDSDF
jgi:hypothetical protein